jgi:hypothetical protein
MRHCYWILPFLLCVGAGTALAADNWTYFADPDGALTLAVPAPPVAGHDSTPGADGKSIPLATYIVEREQGALLLLVSDLSQVADTSHMAQDGVANLKKTAVSGFSDLPIAVDGHSGRDVRLINQGGLKFEDRMFVIGKKMYQVVTVLAADASTDSVAVAQRFAGSIHFIHP